MATGIETYFVSLILTLTLINIPNNLVSVSSMYVSPSNFLDIDLIHGTWLTKAELGSLDHIKLLEGGWIWTETGHLITTHVCRAKRLNGIVPGELLNGTCYISGNPDKTTVYGVHEFHDDWSALLKLDDEVYEWVNFNGVGAIPLGVVVGGIRPNLEPLLICRKVFSISAMAGNIVQGSKAVLGNFSPKDGKCYYELEFGSTGYKFDLSFTSEHFQMLVLRARGKPACLEPRKGN